MFRMNTMTLLSLCNDLETQYGLKPLKRMSVSENVTMFLYIIALGALNREVQKKFQYSSKTVSRYIKEVLIVVCLFVIYVIKLVDSEFTNTLREIAMNPRFMPHFKVRYILFIVGTINLNCFNECL
jgi:low temperature requirement protein LtrA